MGTGPFPADRSADFIRALHLIESSPPTLELRVCKKRLYYVHLHRCPVDQPRLRGTAAL